MGFRIWFLPPARLTFEFKLLDFSWTSPLTAQRVTRSITACPLLVMGMFWPCTGCCGTTKRKSASICLVTGEQVIYDPCCHPAHGASIQETVIGSANVVGHFLGFILRIKFLLVQISIFNWTLICDFTFNLFLSDLIVLVRCCL